MEIVDMGADDELAVDQILSPSKDIPLALVVSYGCCNRAALERIPGFLVEGHFNFVAGVPEDNRKLADDQSAKLIDLYPLEKSGEPMIAMTESLVCDIPRTFIVNTLNTGAYVPGIPRDFEVEIPALVSKHGIQPIQMDGLPPR